MRAIDARGARGRARRFAQRLALRRVVASPRVLHAFTGALRLYQRSGLQRALHATRLLALVPPLGRMERMLPRIPDAHRAPLLVPARGVRRGRVAFFSGCVMPEIFGPVNAATIDVLARNGFEVEVPAGQAAAAHCTATRATPGQPIRHRTPRIAAFRLDGIDALILNSAGCARCCATPATLAQRFATAEFLADAGLRETPRPLPAARGLRRSVSSAPRSAHRRGPVRCCARSPSSSSSTCPAAATAAARPGSTT
jgi:glycolate oxidase iron-sulfur subunit